MVNKKKKFEKRPEQDRNNVAYYKKNKTDEIKNGNQAQKSSTPIEDHYPKEQSSKDEPKSWANIVSARLARLDTQSDGSNGTAQRKTTRIKPEFESDSSGYDRIVITPTHFNNKPFNGFIKDDEAKNYQQGSWLARIRQSPWYFILQERKEHSLHYLQAKKKHVNRKNLRFNLQVLLV